MKTRPRLGSGHRSDGTLVNSHRSGDVNRDLESVGGISLPCTTPENMHRYDELCVIRNFLDLPQVFELAFVSNAYLLTLARKALFRSAKVRRWRLNLPLGLRRPDIIAPVTSETRRLLV